MKYWFSCVSSWTFFFYDESAGGYAYTINQQPSPRLPPLPSGFSCCGLLPGEKKEGMLFGGFLGKASKKHPLKAVVDSFSALYTALIRLSKR